MTDRESVERPWASPMLASLLQQMANQPGALDSYVIASGASMAITEIRALRAALDAAEARAEKAEAEVDRLRTALKRISWVLDGEYGAMEAQAYRYAVAALQETDR